MVDQTIRVEVAYARPEEQVILEVRGAPSMTVKQAIEASGILQRFPEIELGQNKFGVFGKVARADAVLNPDDRVEIYRPLIADPKEQRKKRAAEGKALKKRT